MIKVSFVVIGKNNLQNTIRASNFQNERDEKKKKTGIQFPWWEGRAILVD